MNTNQPGTPFWQSDVAVAYIDARKCLLAEIWKRNEYCQVRLQSARDHKDEKNEKVILKEQASLFNFIDTERVVFQTYQKPLVKSLEISTDKDTLQIWNVIQQAQVDDDIYPHLRRHLNNLNKNLLPDYRRKVTRERADFFTSWIMTERHFDTRPPCRDQVHSWLLHCLS